MSDDTTPQWVDTFDYCDEGEHLFHIMQVIERDDEEYDEDIGGYRQIWFHCVKCSEPRMDMDGLIMLEWATWNMKK
tara:strand:+ start:304 stop:531 length:228 start_codon:yes stop_codon:yes gene_type:complete